MAQKGWQVTIAEQAEELSEVGAGLQVSPNGINALRALGVEPSLSFAPEAIEMRLGESGRQVFRIALAEYAQIRWNAPYLNIHRADLLEALHTRARAMTAITIKLNLRLVSYAQSDRVSAIFYSGEALSADLLIGADGLHSVVRRQMHGAEKPRFTGNVAWRFTAPAGAVSSPPPPVTCAWAGEGKHAVTYYLRGGELLNFVGITETPGTELESWTGRGKIEDLKALYHGWHPNVTSAIDAVDSVRHWALYDRAPLPYWSEGNVVILGDAAHPALPSLAQGACMAIEDAVALANCLESSNGPAEFYAKRIARVSRMQQDARKNLTLFHKRGILQKALNYGPLFVGSRIFPHEAHRRLDWLYGFAG